MPEVKTPFSTNIYYSKMGAGPVIVLLHGFPESGTLWRRITGRLSASATLIIPDFPGSGSSALQGSISVDDMALCIDAILEAEGIEKAVIAGHSMGGYVGFAFARLFPDKVAGLSLVHSTPAADDDEKKVARRKSIELIRRGAKMLFISQMIPNLFSDAFKQSHPELVEEQITEGYKMTEEGMINFYNAMIGRIDHTYLLDQVRFPIQWIIGIQDNLIYYKKILELCDVSPVNFVSYYNNCGHMSMLENPVQLAADLEKFITYCAAVSMNENE